MSESSPRLVVDSSVVVKWFLDEGEPGVDRALTLLESHSSGKRVLAAPSHVVLEVLNALLHRGLDAEGLGDAADALLDARLELHPIEDFAREAAGIATRHKLTLYDAAFAALAVALESELLTADRRLADSSACSARLLEE